MNNLYEKQALDKYLNDGIIHGKKMSYGSLGRTRNKITTPSVNYAQQSRNININKNVNKNGNKPSNIQVNKNSNKNSNIQVNKNGNKPSNIQVNKNVNKKISLLQNLTKKEEELWNTLGMTISDIDSYLLLQKLTTKEDELWNTLGMTISDIDSYLEENNASSTCQVTTLHNFEIPNKIEQND